MSFAMREGRPPAPEVIVGPSNPAARKWGWWRNRAGCGERVMRFAAGCALCGADLDIRRHDRRPGLLEGTHARVLEPLRRPRLRPKPLLQDWDTKGWQFVLLLFVLLFSCSIAGLIASDVMALLGRLLPFL